MSSLDRVVASAPGSVMITGEHAVVYGHPALVAAVDQRVRVEVRKNEAGRLRIVSEIAAPADYAIDALPEDGPYRFLVAAYRLFSNALDGVDVTVSSEIDPKLGLGSSAAVTIASLGALSRLASREVNIHSEALQIVRSIQGRGSGADLAASFMGGCVEYRAGSETVIAPIGAPPPMALRYAGYKTPTAEVLAQVAAAYKGREAERDAIYTAMGATVAETIAHVRRGDWSAVGPSLTAYQDLMVRLGVSDDTLDQIVAEAAGTPGLLACKISGSGLGDCVLALGARPEGFIDAKLATKGLSFEH